MSQNSQNGCWKQTCFKHGTLKTLAAGRVRQEAMLNRRLGGIESGRSWGVTAGSRWLTAGVTVLVLFYFLLKGGGGIEQHFMLNG